MNILDRFSTHLRDTLARSIQLATELKNPEVEPIHLLFCLSNQKGSVAAEIINRFKLNPKTLEQALLGLATGTEVAPATPGSAPPQVLTPLSNATKACLEKAMIIAQEHNHNYIGTEHLLAAVVHLDNHMVNDVLKVNTIRISELQKQLATVLANATQFPRITEVAEVVERIQENLGDMVGGEPPATFPDTKKGKKKETALEFFATNLTSLEAQKNIDPVIGREQEIERAIQILCRRTKNNPLLLGDPGVGKTAIVEGLAKRIMEGKVPDLLLNKKIYALDMGMLIAGTIYRGEFEGRLRHVIEEVVHDSNIILFIDEVHNIVGAGSNQGTMDAANILKPALSRGLIRCIGATTPNEYKKYIESDPALERRFQPVITKEPSVEDTIHILEGIKKNYETFHNVTISAAALTAAAQLADRYITSKFLPDKAIDLLDETAAAKRLTAKTSSIQSKLARLHRHLEQTILAKEQAASADKFHEAVELKKEEERLQSEIKKHEARAATKTIKRCGVINDHDVAEQLAKIIGTNPRELLLDNVSQLMALEQKLAQYIIGQNKVVTTVSQIVRQAQLGLSHPDRPLASFLFVGQSGVGKTELAKTLARVLYSNKDALIKLDMTEFNESFSVSKLLGSPAGYVGYKENNQFTDKIKLNPYSVILFDEIDKAHKDVRKLLLQMLENGEVTDSAGKKVSLRHTIIILTTTYGAEESAKGALGFGHNRQQDMPEQEQRLTEKLKEYFSPEIINRLDAICFFNPLSTVELIKVAELELQRLNSQLKNYHTAVSAAETVLQWVVNHQGNPTKQGAREIRQFLRHHVEQLFADAILAKRLRRHYHLAVINEHLAIK